MRTSPKENAQFCGHRESTDVKELPRACVGLRTEIDLCQPYEVGLSAAISLPRTSRSGNEDQKVGGKVTKIFRRLYEAANGRQIWTVIGPISLAPAVAPWLKKAPLSFSTQEELFDFVAKLNGASDLDFETRR